ncbi:MAG TPA: M48 family peptidase, partial [Neisseria sp.]|nr:M48 family peptidase [Neisseria sp.]
MKTRTLRLSALFTAAALTTTGCTSVADMMGYDTATLNASAAKSYTQVVQQAQDKRV